MTKVKNTEKCPVPGSDDIDKIEKYGWTSSGKPMHFAWINKSKLNIGRYQREFKKAKVLELSSAWHHYAVQALTVGIRKDGTMWVVDGQHRLRAACNRSDISDLPCMCFDSTGEEEESTLWELINKHRKVPAPREMFKAECIAKNPTALYVKSLLEQYGIEIHPGTTTKIRVPSIGVMLNFASKGENGKQALDFALDVISSISNPGLLVPHTVVYGICYMYLNYTIPNEVALRSAMLETTIPKLVSSIDLVRNLRSHGGERIYAEGVALCVNPSLSKKDKIHHSQYPGEGIQKYKKTELT
ncbi:MAG TPA: hypothetical protein O0X50_00370 [Methanocorpusculum sp.]|nr:hypothetical protein [Methanocorpusculum sp.]